MKEVSMLSKMLKILRILNKKSIKDVEKEIGLGDNVYGNYERGKRLPDINTIIRIAKYYNVSVDFLMGRTDYPNVNTASKKEYTMDVKEVGVTLLEMIDNVKIKDLEKEEMADFIKVSKIIKEREKL